MGRQQEQAETTRGLRGAPFYQVVAYQRGVAVCEVASVGQGVDAATASYFARDLREEFPGAIVAILPQKSGSFA
ncbi:hypothetical protein [Streptomyces sp. Da 82-17]|uniref:hypothetical protein n=1 Tax=Streptomyces sp. Da 82-17 TaxID=3377116 RepID=UPI0038D42B8E